MKRVRQTLNAYAALFLSDRLEFSVVVFLASFLHPWAGFCGLLSVIFANECARILGVSPFSIQKGYYGFNALLTGLGLGATFCMNPLLIFMVMIASVFCLFLTVVMEGVMGKYGLPYLSLPFVITFWMMMLASRYLPLPHAVMISGNISSEVLLPWVHYLRSLGAVLFSPDIFTGGLIAVGLLRASRIAFGLSLVGFFGAWFLTSTLSLHWAFMDYGFLGYNVILTTIALGGIFLIPSIRSYTLVLGLVPLTLILSLALNSLISQAGLGLLSLPFNVMVSVVLYTLYQRKGTSSGLEMVWDQHVSPELNLYSQVSRRNRFKWHHVLPLSLPFWNEWTISQAHHGSETHRADWAHAWDFVMTDSNGLTYRGEGQLCEEYFSYNRPVLSPSDGVIEQTVDGIADNSIGQVNVNHNWGNTVVIRHQDGLFTQLSHLKKGSVCVQKGQYVRKGEIIGYCGNSGRSAEPHLHMQIQATPLVGSRTLDFPLGYYWKRFGDRYELCQYDKPLKGDHVSNLIQTALLQAAFRFLPGQKLIYEVTNQENRVSRVEWDVVVDAWNQSYLYCSKTQSKAYFYNDGFIHYFRNFEGNRRSVLFCFFMALYKVPLEFKPHVVVKDHFAPHHLTPGIIRFWVDFVAPFFTLFHSEYELTCGNMDSEVATRQISLTACSRLRIGKMVLQSLRMEAIITSKGIQRITVNKPFSKNRFNSLFFGEQLKQLDVCP